MSKVINYKKSVIEAVENELKEFKEEMIAEKPEKIFNSYYRINCYVELQYAISEEYFFDSENDDTEIYKALYQMKGNILYNLVESAMEDDYLNINSMEEVIDFIRNYCHDNYADIDDYEDIYED